MNCEKDRLSSSWAQIALFADLTWATEPPDDFVIANRRLWIQHCYIAQLLEATSLTHPNAVNQPELLEKRPQFNTKFENNGQNIRDRVKVSSNTRLRENVEQYHYEGVRGKSYSTPAEASTTCSTSGHKGSEALECWMLPEVEFWCKKMMETSSDSRRFPLRSRLYKRREIDFERAEEYDLAVTSLTARVDSVRGLWHQSPSPPPSPRKMRARRRKPRRVASTTPPSYNLQATAPLIWRPTTKFQLQSFQHNERQKKVYLSSKSGSNEFMCKTSVNKCNLYRGTNVSRYTPTSQRPIRFFEKRNNITWPKINTTSHNNIVVNIKTTFEENDNKIIENKDEPSCLEKVTEKDGKDKNENITLDEENVVNQAVEVKEDQVPKDTHREIEETKPIKKASAEVKHKETVAEIPICIEKKRLYSTVLSTQPIIAPTVKATKKSIIPGLIKLNPKIISTTRIRLTNVDDLEKEALEQYKASDESIDSKFNELEKQAVEQYSTSNSNTSCSSGNSAEKSKTITKPEQLIKKNTKYCKEKVNNMLTKSNKISEQQLAKGQTSSMNLKNFQTPPRGDKKDQKPKSNKNQRKFRKECQKAQSDTDYEFKELKNLKGPKKWLLRIAPKKRHLKVCASDTSDEETRGLVKITSIKSKHDSKLKKYDRAGGDLNPALRKSN